MSTFSQIPGTKGANVLSIALIGPEERRRKTVSRYLAEPQGGTVREYSFYPDLGDVPRLLEHNYDVIIVDLDVDPEFSLKLVEAVSKGTATVMIYSENADSAMVVRAMRSGAREFLTLPLAPDTVSEALGRVRGSVRTKETRLPGPGARVPFQEARPAPVVPESRSYDLGTRAATPAPAVPEPRVPTPEVRSFTPEPRAPETRSFEPTARTATPEPRPFASEPRAPESRSFEPARVPTPEPRPAFSYETPRAPEPHAQETRSFEPPARVPAPEVRPPAADPRAFEPAARAAAPEPRPAFSYETPRAPEPRSFEPAARVPAPEVRPPAPEPRAPEPRAPYSFETTRVPEPPRSPETRPFEPPTRVPAPEFRQPAPEPRSFEPAARATAPEPRVSVPEIRTPAPEPRSFEPAARATAPESRAVAPEVRPPAPETRAFDPAARATAPATRPNNPGTRLSSHGSRLSTHGTRVPSPESRPFDPGTRSTAPEARVTAPEAPVIAPDVHVAPASDVRVATPDVRAAVSEAPAVATAARLIQKAGSGKLLSFVGAKGGAGTTCLASNFAVSLAEESGKRTILIDLNLPLGNVALELGVNAQYSTVDALKNSTRLDATFLSKLLVKHRSGLHVLAAPDNFAQPVQVTPEAIENLLNVARQEFEYVVVDAGVRHELKDSAFLEESAHLYLVTQDGLPELRNSNRLIAEYFASGGPKLDIVLNRYMGRTESNGMYSSHLVDDKHITKALTREVSWKIPSDPSEAVLVAVDSAVSRAIRAMARSVCGLPAIQEPKKKFSLFPQKKKPFKFLD